MNINFVRRGGNEDDAIHDYLRNQCSDALDPKARIQGAAVVHQSAHGTVATTRRHDLGTTTRLRLARYTGRDRLPGSREHREGVLHLLHWP